nr:TonB-dependent receptor [Polyangium spumosum]
MGGPGLLSRFTADRVEGRAVVTLRARGLGEHRIRAGVNFEIATLSKVQGYSGAALLRETLGGGFVQDEAFGYLRGPDDPVTYDTIDTRVTSYAAGVFLADTWRIRENLVAEASLRWDAQLFGGGALVFPFMLAPRAGIAWDPTKKGRARVFVSYGMRYQAVPLDVAARGLASEPRISSFHQSPPCRVNEPADLYGGCDRASQVQVHDVSHPSTDHEVRRGQVSIDPATSAPASHQITAGVDIAGPLGTRVGLVYVRDQLLRALEDTNTAANGLLIGNPGSGAAAMATQAERTYHGLSITLMRPFADGFVGLASYTLASSYGNYSGLFRPETGQLDPNVTRDFDLPELDENRTGALPGDHTHSIKLYAGKEFFLPKGVILEAGAGYTGRSGAPYGALGAHAAHGPGEVFLLPRGSVGRTPWVHRIDARLGVSALLRKDLRLGASVEVYNLADSQTPTAFDQNYTYDSAVPVEDGATKDDIPELYTKNPRYEKPVAWQAPRQVRFGLRVDY